MENEELRGYASEPQPDNTYNVTSDPVAEIPEETVPVYDAPTQEDIPTPESATPQNRYTPQIPAKKSKGGFIMAVIAIGLGCAILGGSLGAFLYSLLNNGPVRESKPANNKTQVQIDHDDDAESTDMLEGKREDSVIDIHEIDTSKLLTAAEVYAQNVNSTVGITTSITTNYWGFQSTSAASGSGFIISDNGYILTNYHVIQNSNSITVALYDGTEYDAELIGYDESNDIAVLKVDATNLTPVILGDSDNLNVGDPVVAIGNPLGELTFSLTAGTISAMNRNVTIEGTPMQLIQTDCAINSGNSGGALFNMYGEVIGITNAKYSSSNSGASIDNIGFAIPLNDVRNIFESLIEKGYVSKPFIGVTVTDVSEESILFGIPAGAVIRSTVENSPAEECGLLMGDIITHVDDQEISGSTALVNIISDCDIGQELKLTVYRKGETLELTLTVGEQTQSAQAQQQQQQQIIPFP